MTRIFAAALAALVAGPLFAQSVAAQAPHRQVIRSRVPRMASGYPMPAAMRAARRSRIPSYAAPMYPCPIQNIPVQMGGTMFTNQAFAPHEMLYGHEYRAMYAPFYYRVKGHWLWTPLGIESHDKWDLVGTEVKVKYRTDYNPLGAFFPRATN